MPAESTPLDRLVARTLAAVAGGSEAPAEAAPPAAATMRERFFELIVLSMANLYGKTPVAAAMFDRSMLRVVSEGLDDNDAGKLSVRSEDWIRLEGLVRVLEGQKSYTLNRPSIAVLSTATEAGSLGEVFEKVGAAYAARAPSPELRRCARQLASYFMTRLGRS